MNHNNIEYNISNHQNLKGVDTNVRVNLWTFCEKIIPLPESWRSPPQEARGGQTRLPKFKFSAKFPIGLHVILQIQIRNSKMTAILCEKLF